MCPAMAAACCCCGNWSRRLLAQRRRCRVEGSTHPELMTHSVTDMLKQRVFGLCLGYEDLNDHGEAARRDVLLQTAVERDTPLAS